MGKGSASWASPYLFQVDKPISISWSINKGVAYARVLPPQSHPLLPFGDLKPVRPPVYLPVFVFVSASHLEDDWNTWPFREHLI
ncbi:predicted protein [Lichtheimia corymbifera JMRC:FSU:9682]|uniref:Uncharacterized protein n=1 Tax=Lichtheimia corymbifera JMRC:FSU:9682 TaxID=1263082 RepID=A0A068SAP3_9FUNG|nr:predicted protein [Lichtheimia corymbifera JMRC:FSU:9682]